MNSPLPNQYSGHKIAQKTAWGFIWNFSAYFLGKIIVLITTAILARVLAKSDFGLVAVGAAPQADRRREMGDRTSSSARKGRIESFLRGEGIFRKTVG